MRGAPLLACMLASACGHLCVDPIPASADAAADTPGDALGACPAPVGNCAAVECEGVCYQLCDDFNTWQQAQTACTQRGGCLATIDTQAKALCIGIALSGSTRPEWIGVIQALTATTPDEAWSWTCTLTPAQVPWGPTEPNDNGGGETHEEDCAYISAPQGAIVDYACGSGNGFVCQMPR